MLVVGIGTWIAPGWLGAGGGLTPAEQRVAELAVSGRSNKEIAAQLYPSVYTVQAHLSWTNAKLGVRSHAQLARHLGTSAQLDGVPAPVKEHRFH